MEGKKKKKLIKFDILKLDYIKEEKGRKGKNFCWKKYFLKCLIRGIYFRWVYIYIYVYY